MQRITIRDFRSIKNCELDLAQFIVLTGAFDDESPWRIVVVKRWSKDSYRHAEPVLRHAKIS